VFIGAAFGAAFLKPEEIGAQADAGVAFGVGHDGVSGWWFSTSCHGSVKRPQCQGASEADIAARPTAGSCTLRIH
jgi:hypothetical protein